MSIVSIERRGRVAIVRFDRQDRANAMSMEVIRQLTAAARSFESDAQTSAIVLTGPAHVFTNGADLKDPERERLKDASFAERRLLMQAGGKMCRAWEELEPVTIAAIEGWCVGGGAALAVACDLRVASSAANFYVPEIERGMNLSWGAVPRLVHLAGPAKTKRLIVLSEKVGAGAGRAGGEHAAGAGPHDQAGRERGRLRAGPRGQPRGLRPVRAGSGLGGLRRGHARVPREASAALHGSLRRRPAALRRSPPGGTR